MVLLTGHAGSDLVGRAAAAGASSLMPKDGSLTDLLVALRTAGHGVLVVHHSLLERGGRPTGDLRQRTPGRAEPA